MNFDECGDSMYVLHPSPYALIVVGTCDNTHLRHRARERCGVLHSMLLGHPLRARTLYELVLLTDYLVEQKQLPAFSRHLCC